MRSEPITAHGKTMTLKEWAKHLGVEYKTLWQRVKKLNISIEQALTADFVKKAPTRDPSKTMTKNCLQCGKAFVIPKCREWREHCCSTECKDAHRVAELERRRSERTRQCKHCSKLFVARKTQIDEGGGNFCSVACHRSHVGIDHLFTPEVQKRAAERMREMRAAGLVRVLRGPDSPTWKGGKVKNPEKNRRYSRRRWQLTRAPLPKDLVANLFVLQKGKCPACQRKLKKFHKDHIVPLALGGKHEASNIQLLCPSCNHKKSAKDPVEFMQENGFLL